MICPASGPDAPPQPKRCDDTEYGNGAGGQLAYEITLKAGEVRTVWFGVGGSDPRPRPGPRRAREALADPEARFRARSPAAATSTRPATCRPARRPAAPQSVAWSKQMLAASEQRVEDLQLRVVNAGKAYPPPAGTADSMRWLGAGWPDYTVAVRHRRRVHGVRRRGRWPVRPIKAICGRCATSRRWSTGAAARSSTRSPPTARSSSAPTPTPGNTDESSKYPSAVALVWRWTGDKSVPHDLYPACVRRCSTSRPWTRTATAGPRGSATSSATGMGEEKLDNAVYTIRGYADLADLARPAATDHRAVGHPAGQGAARRSSRTTWWYDQDGAKSYADSLDDPGNEKVFQRHWIGLTPTDAVLPGCRAAAARPAGLARAREHHARPARAVLLHRRARALPHRHRADLRPRRQPRRQLRLGGLRGAQRAEHLHAEQRDRRGQRGQLRSARRRAAGRLRLRQRAEPARPDAVGDARRDAGDRPRR